MNRALAAVGILALLLTACSGAGSAEASGQQTGTPSATLARAPSSASSSTEPALLGRRLGAVSIGASVADLRAALGLPTEQTITHGIGSAEWVYGDAYVVRLHGPQSSPADVWQVIAYESSNARTSEGFAIHDTNDRFRRIYAGRRIDAFVTPGSQDQLQVSDGTLVLLANFGADGRATYVSLKLANR